MQTPGGPSNRKRSTSSEALRKTGKKPQNSLTQARTTATYTQHHQGLQDLLTQIETLQRERDHYANEAFM